MQASAFAPRPVHRRYSIDCVPQEAVARARRREPCRGVWRGLRACIAQAARTAAFRCRSEPYMGTCFGSTRETDIEYIVAASEAHDSGLCSADADTRARFARDLRNLTLASPRVNRCQRRAGRMPPSGFRPGIPAGSRHVSSRSVVPTGSRSTGARRRRSSASSPAARARLSSPSSARCRPPREAPPLPPLLLGTTPSRCTTTMGTEGLPARRPAGMELLRCRGRTRRTGTCGMGMGSFASNGAEGQSSRPHLPPLAFVRLVCPVLPASRVWR